MHFSTSHDGKHYIKNSMSPKWKGRREAQYKRLLPMLGLGIVKSTLPYSHITEAILQHAPMTSEPQLRYRKFHKYLSQAIIYVCMYVCTHTHTHKHRERERERERGEGCRLCYFWKNLKPNLHIQIQNRNFKWKIHSIEVYLRYIVCFKTRNKWI